MKITCSSCGSKYTIADAKVQGKKVKVRCKSCKESILVDGTQLSGESSDDDSESAPTSSPQASLPPSPDNEGMKDKDLWSVNLSDDDSREMTLEQLIAGWKNGTVTSDAYVWKDGMGDWKPILEVGELKLKLGQAPVKGVVSSAGGKVPPKAKASHDLFGSMEVSPGEAAPKGAAKAAAEAKPTGARNDSSVLFSLDSLTSPSGGQGQSSTAANMFGDLGTAPGALTTNTDLLMAPPKDPPPAPIGARVAVALPVTQEKKGGGKGLLIGAIVGGILVVGGAVFAMSGGGSAEAEKAAAAAKADAEAEAEKAKAALEEERKKMQEQQATMKADLEKAKKEAEEAQKKEPEAAATKPAEEDKAKEEAAKAAGSSPSGSSSSSGTASSGSSAPSASAAAPAFNVGAAKSALGAAAANAAACAKPGGPTGSGKVQVTFSPSGRVTSANVVSGPFGGTSVGGCVASTFRRARVPAFSGSPTTVSKGFSIK